MKPRESSEDTVGHIPTNGSTLAHLLLGHGGQWPTPHIRYMGQCNQGRASSGPAIRTGRTRQHRLSRMQDNTAGLQGVVRNRPPRPLCSELP